jgi:glycosyltransferase involved in cell wall biosynthesis
MIDILLPVYNGEKYIKEQIESLENQTFKDFKIIIRNDGSSDSSATLLDFVASKYDNIILIKDEKGNLGLSKTLEILIRASSSEYFMFCDQDDKWMPNKIEISYEAIKNIESKHPNTPILVCTDSTCVDDNEKIISQSFFKSQKYTDVTDNPVKIAAMNVVQGNTCILNSFCKQYILPFPPYVLYDHWCGIMISHYGIVKYIHQPTLWYRQHQCNVLGVNNVNTRYFASKLVHVQKQFRIYRSIFKNIPFHISILKWCLYKIYFSLKRIRMN